MNKLSKMNNVVRDAAELHGVELTDNAIGLFNELLGLRSELDEKTTAMAVVVAALAKENYGYKAVIASALGFGGDTVNMLEEVGNGKRHYRLVNPKTPGERELGNMPMSDQEKWLNEAIPVALPEGNDRRVWVYRLNKIQRKQVFGVNSVRTLQEQIPFMEEALARTTKRAGSSDVIQISTKKMKLVITHGEVSREVSHNELLAFLSKMSKA